MTNSERVVTRCPQIFEPPGETHTLIVKPDPQDASSDDMMVLFHNFGPLMHVDDKGVGPIYLKRTSEGEVWVFPAASVDGEPMSTQTSKRV